jgi:anti-sigma regulatory factor (Ser/Thr protein kinase)
LRGAQAGQDPAIAVPLELSLSATADAPARARGAVAAWLARDHGDRSLVENALLVVSELVTNAIRHADAGPAEAVRLTARAAPGAVRIAVLDGGTGGEVRRRADRPADDFGGYGLALVDQIARAWGVERDERGTTVWAELRADEP